MDGLVFGDPRHQHVRRHIERAGGRFLIGLRLLEEKDRTSEVFEQRPVGLAIIGVDRF